MSVILFTCSAPAASWSPSVNPRYGGGYAINKTRFQPMDLSDGGDLYSYSRGERDGRIFEWAALPSADMDSLLIFLAAVCGGRYPFTFIETFPGYSQNITNESHERLTDESMTHIITDDANVFTSCRILNFESFPIKNITRTHYECFLELEVA